jgi:hypothetical protein
VVEEYTALLARAFNGAVEVDGQRIVAHPSGILIARDARPMAMVLSTSSAASATLAAAR